MNNNDLIYSSSIKDLEKKWKKFLPKGKKLLLPKGHTLIDKSQIIKYLYYLEEGEVSFIHKNEDGKKVLLGKSKGPNLLGDVILFFDNPIESATIITNTPCTLYQFDSDWIYSELIPNYPELVVSIIQSISAKTMKLVKQKVFNNTDALTSIICNYIKENIAYGKNELYSRTNLTQTELAEFFGVHRTTISKSIKRLKDLGIIEGYNRKKTKVLNLDLLNELTQNSK